MNNWISKEINVGNIRQHKILYLSFVATPQIKDINLIVPGCGCTDCKYDTNKRMLNVVFKSGNIPNHISGNQDFNKMIKVLYKDGSHDELFISGTKLRE